MKNSKSESSTAKDSSMAKLGEERKNTSVKTSKKDASPNENEAKQPTNTNTDNKRSAVMKDSPKSSETKDANKKAAVKKDKPATKKAAGDSTAFVTPSPPPLPSGEKIKTILITQENPGTDRNPYVELAKKHKLKIDYRAFIHVEGVESLDFRQQRVTILEHTAVIFTSRNAVDHFFRLTKDLRLTIPDSMRYFCMSEAIAYYLQKYIQYRKRKIFFGQNTFQDLMDPIRKFKNEKFLLPCSDLLKHSIPETLTRENINFSKAVMYKTVCSDLSDLADVKYDMLVFFSPSDIESLFKNFPDFTQNTTKIAIFGQTTAKAVQDALLRIDVFAPNPKAPSMSMAIEQYITGK